MRNNNGSFELVTKEEGEFLFLMNRGIFDRRGYFKKELSYFVELYHGSIFIIINDKPPLCISHHSDIPNNAFIHNPEVVKIIGDSKYSMCKIWQI